MDVLLGWVLAVASQAAEVAPAQAQTTAEARDVAQSLARQAVDCLVRGEDAPALATRLEQYHRGLALAERAVAADQRSADAQFALSANLARLTLLEDDPPNPLRLLQAQRALEAALLLNPQHPDALAARGGLYRQLPRWLGRNLDKAAAYLRDAVRLDSDNIGARIELALTYRDLGEPQRGVPLLEEAVVIAERRKRPRKVDEARRLLAEIQAESGLPLLTPTPGPGMGRSAGYSGEGLEDRIR